MLNRSLISLIAATLAANSGLSQQAWAGHFESTQTVPRDQRNNSGSGNWLQYSYLNHGPTAAQVKRAAKKARNVQRHKRHVRG